MLKMNRKINRVIFASRVWEGVRQQQDDDNNGSMTEADAAGDGSSSAADTADASGGSSSATKNPKDVFRSLGCYIAEMDSRKRPHVPAGFKMHPGREPQTESEFQAVYNAESWAILPLRDSSIIMLDQDSGTIDMQLARYFNRMRRKYVTKTDEIESRHGFLHVYDADHEWCAEFASRYHLKIAGLEIYAERHWVIYEGAFTNPGDSGMLTSWQPLSEQAVIRVSKIELEDVFGRLCPAAYTKGKRQAVQGGSRRTASLMVKAGTGGRHMALIGLAFDVYAWLVLERQHGKKRQLQEPITEKMMYDKIMSDGRDRIEAVNEYETGEKRRELDDIISYVLQAGIEQAGQDGSVKQDQRTLSLSMGRRVITDMLKCAHLSVSPGSLTGYDMYNCWYWDGCMWQPNTEYEVYRLLLTLQSESLVPTSKMARTITEMMSASITTLTVNPADPKYADGMMRRIINTHGEYFDLDTGDIRRIDPQDMWFERPHMSIGFSGADYNDDAGTADDDDDDEKTMTNKGPQAAKAAQAADRTDATSAAPASPDNAHTSAPTAITAEPPPPLEASSDEPAIVFRCMSLWFSPDDMRILLDHLAGALVHTAILGAKPKILYVVGSHNTYKSMWVALMTKIMYEKSITAVAPDEIAERFGMSMIAESVINMLEEQDAVNVNSPARFKDAVTKVAGPVTKKYATTQIYASRFPRHLIMCNVVQPIGFNDEDDSIFIRSQYITTKKAWDTPEDELEARNTDWYARIIHNDAEVRRFALWLLRRAHQICKKQGENFHVQTLDDSRRAYHRLMHGTFEQFVKERYIECDQSVGVVWRRIYNDYREAARSNIDYKKFKTVLAEGGFEAVRGRFYKTDQDGVLTGLYGPWHEEKGMERQDVIQTIIVQGLVPRENVPVCAGGDGAGRLLEGGSSSGGPAAAADSSLASGTGALVDGTKGVVAATGAATGAGIAGIADTATIPAKSSAQAPQALQVMQAVQTAASTDVGESKAECTCCGHASESLCRVHECTCCMIDDESGGIPRHSPPAP